MGRSKQQLPFRGSTLAGTVVRTLLQAGVDGLVVVTRMSLVKALDLPVDPRIELAFNENRACEMIDSIRIGLATLAEAHLENRDATPVEGVAAGPSAVRASSGSSMHCSSLNADGVLVVPADMPILTAAACRACVRTFKSDPERIVIATSSGRRGHPIIFPFSMRYAVDRLEGGLNELPLQYSQRVRLVAVDDAGVTCDVDTMRDYTSLPARNPDNDVRTG